MQQPLVVKYTKKQYEIPDEGIVNGTLAEVKDLGEMPTAFGSKDKILWVWETDQIGRNGKPMKVFQRFTKSLHPKALLYKALRSITGEEPGEEFDLSSLIGTQVQLVIQHNEGEDGITYANVASIFRPKTAEEEASERRVETFVEAAQRKQGAFKIKKETNLHGVEVDNNDMPF